MAEYHVGCGAFGNIYAGTMSAPRKDGLQMWRNKSDVTDEAIKSVMGISSWKWSVPTKQNSKRRGALSETRS